MSIKKIDNEFLKDVIEEIVLPFSEILESDEKVKVYFDSNEKTLQHRIDIAKLALGIIKDKEYVFMKLERAAIAHNGLGIETDIMEWYLTLFFKLLNNLMLKKFGESSLFEKDIAEYKTFFMKVYNPDKIESEDNNDDFFDFDSEGIDEAIDKMHYTEDEKIDAKTFAQENIFDDEMMHDLDDALDIFDAVSVADDTLSQRYMEGVIHALELFARVYASSYEFRNMEYALRQLQEMLESIDIDSLDENEKRSYKAFLDAIISDLAKWEKSVLIEQDALDIHYLDASLLSNVAQIEIMIESSKNKKEDSEDDIEFF